MKFQVPASLSRALHTTAFKMKKHSPELLVVGGTIGVVASFVMACRASTKVGKVLEETKETINTIREVSDKLPEKYTDEDAQQDLIIAYTQMGVKLVKLYAPSVILGTLSLGCILTSNHILQKRNGALAAAYATIEKSYHEYRDRVKDRYGEEAEKEIRYNVKAKEIMKKETDPKTGEEKEVKETVQTGEPTEYARFFDEACPSWSKNPEHNMLFIRNQQRFANDLLRARGHLFLNEVYDLFDIPRTQAGQIVGWVFGKDGDGYVDFGLYDIRNSSSRRFVNGDDCSILLDFNVQGNILNKL